MARAWPKLDMKVGHDQSKTPVAYEVYRSKVKADIDQFKKACLANIKRTLEPNVFELCKFDINSRWFLLFQRSSESRSESMTIFAKVLF